MLINKETLSREEYDKLLETLNISIDKVNKHYQSLSGKDLNAENLKYKRHLESLTDNLKETLNKL